jgi:hypothetical protein
MVSFLVGMVAGIAVVFVGALWAASTGRLN